MSDDVGKYLISDNNTNQDITYWYSQAIQHNHKVVTATNKERRVNGTIFIYTDLRTWVLDKWLQKNKPNIWDLK